MVQNLLSPVPLQERLEVYEKALVFYKSRTDVISRLDVNNGLCLILPCIMWGLRNFLDNAPDGTDWVHCETPIAFPDIAADINRIIEMTGFLGGRTYDREAVWQMRVNALERAIVSVKNQL